MKMKRGEFFLNTLRPALLVLLLIVASCQDAAEIASDGCSNDRDCSGGLVCNQEVGQCQPLAVQIPNLEISPAENDQGWVIQEFPEQEVGLEGMLELSLEQGGSVMGVVYASDSEPSTTGQEKHLIPAEVTFWRDSLIPGRPKVQFSAKALTNLREDIDSPYTIWLNRGQTYTAYVSPLEPYDTQYPPLVVKEIKVTDHLKKDFILDGEDRAITVTGRVVDSAGDPLEKKVRVRAFRADGLSYSTLAESNPQSGAFSFLIPGSAELYDNYTVRVEPVSNEMLIPTMDCPDQPLGLVPDGESAQNLGDLQLPPFLNPKEYTIVVQGKDKSPVVGASVTFTALMTQPVGKSSKRCVASYTQAGITDSTGSVMLMLIPGSQKNQIYTMLVKSPPTSQFASQYSNSFEVGQKSGLLGTIILDWRYQIKGHILTQDGLPIKEATIEAQGITSAAATATISASKATASSGKEGEFELYVDPGLYNIEIRPPADLGLPIFGQTGVKIDRNMDDVAFSAPLAKVLLGKVYEASGEGLNQANVQMFDLVPETDLPVTYRAVLRGSARTDKTGAFRLYLPAKE